MADYLGYPEAFRNAGISYTEEPDWRERGHGDITKFNFIVVHHTAGGKDASDIRVVRDGVTGLAGPLSQIVFKRNGEPHIVAAGVAWHAGYGPAMWGAPAGNGNYYSIGIEGVSNGYNDWTPEQRANYPRVVAAILKHAGLPSDRWIFHRDYNTRDGKIDPAGFDKAWFAAEVNRHYYGQSLVQETDIQKCYKANPQLGQPTMEKEEIPTVDTVGRFRTYENGAIYWHPNFGAHAVMVELYKKYAGVGFEIGFLGYPIADEKSIRDNGWVIQFQNGWIYSHPGGTFTVNGVIGSKWASVGYENSEYGYPISDEKHLPDGEGVLQDFERGTCYYHPRTGAYFIKGMVWNEFCNQKWEGTMGYPLTDELSTPLVEGRFNHFEKGSIYYKWNTDHAWSVKGVFLKVWGDLGYENSRLGFPINNEYKQNSFTRQDFEGGSIQFDELSTQIIINGQYIDVSISKPVVDTKPAELPEKPKGYQPTAEEIQLLAENEKRGGISYFANLNDPSTKGRLMGITGEQADNPLDQWFCAMRFGYVTTQPNPSNPAWIKPKDIPGMSQDEKFRLKKYLVGRRLKVTNPKNGRQIVVRPADWGPGVPKRMIDVSETAVKALGAATDDQVTIEWVDPSTPLGPVV